MVHHSVVFENIKSSWSSTKKIKLLLHAIFSIPLLDVWKMQWNTLPCLIQYFVFVCQSFFSIIKSFFTLMAIGDRRIGPSCWGSPAKTSCPPPGVSILNSPARGTRHSGCREWPASSMNTWVKCWSGISPDTNLGKERRDNHRMIWKPWKYIC